MPAQVSGILLVAVFAVAAVAGAVLAWHLVALSAPSVRQAPGRKAGRAAAGFVQTPAVSGSASEPAPAEPGGMLG
jgi:hypothetical protein